MGRILVLYDSLTDCTKKMAEFIAEGAKEIPGHEVRLKSVDEAAFDDVVWADGLAVGTPTNLGGISWKMKKFWDDFAAEHWDKVDGKLACTFSSQGGHGGGAELACQAMGIVLMNFGFLFFGVTDYVSKIHTLHYGATVAKEPRLETDIAACKRLGLRLAEWVAVYFDGRKHLHPLLTTKASKVAVEYDDVDESGSSSTLNGVVMEPSKPVHVVVVKDVPLENQDKWLEMAEELSRSTWTEEGCLKYSYVKSQGSDTKFIIVEEWASQGHLQKHFETEHFKRLVPQLDSISSTVSLDICNDALERRSENPSPSSYQPKLQKKILVFTKATDYVHASLPSASSFVCSYANQMGWHPIVSDDSSLLEEGSKHKFDAIVLVNNSGQLFDTKKEIFSRHIAEGRGILGIHAALASFLDGEDAEGGTKLGYTSPIIEETFGAHFCNHPPPQTGTVQVNSDLASKFSSDLEKLPQSFEHYDEFFNFNINPKDSDGVQVLATVDESSYEGGCGFNPHPVVWYRHLGDNHAPIFCCALGHFSHFYNGLGPHHVRTFLRAGLKFVVKE